jgi:tetratricopeptide (TPR) repeat protein
MSKIKRSQPIPPPKKQVKPSTSTPSSILQPNTVAGAIWVGLAAAALGFLLYFNTLGHDYTLDDFSSIKENWVVKGGLKNIGIIFSTEYRYGSWSSPGSLYRPIPLTMFAFEWQLAPEKPFLMHLMNVLCYALTGWVMWVTWRRVLAAHPPVLAALAVLLFMAHPIHTEVVANIKSRDEILALLFANAALYAIWRYLEHSKAAWLVGAMLAYAAAMFSKEGVITFLAVFPLAIWFFSDKPLSTNLRVLAMMVVPAAIFLLIRQKVLAGQAYSEVYSILDNFLVGAKNSGERLASAFMMCGLYLWKLIVPHPLVCDMGYPQMKPVGFGEWRAVLGFLAYLGMGLWALFNIPRKHPVAFAILYYLATFSIFSNVFLLIGTSYGERLQYAPSFGFTFALAWLICKLLKINDLNQIWNPNGKGATLWAVAGFILAAYSIMTISRNHAWYNSASLYAADLPNSPNCAKLNYHNALEQVRLGMDEKTSTVKDKAQVEHGVACYTRCIELYPEYHDAYGSRGLAYFRLGQYDKAFDDYQVSLKYRPNNAEVLSNMGYIYFMRNQLEKAEESYRKSVQYDPRFVDARRNLGVALVMKKDFEGAIAQWKEGLKYATSPNNAILYFYIGSAYRDKGEPEKSTEWFERAYAIDPTLRK